MKMNYFNLPKRASLSLFFGKSLVEIFLSTLQQLPSLPDYRTIQSDLRSLEKKILDRLKYATHYGVQLGHWIDFNRNSFLVVIASFITDSFIDVVHVINFKDVLSIGGNFVGCGAHRLF